MPSKKGSSNQQIWYKDKYVSFGIVGLFVMGVIIGGVYGSSYGGYQSITAEWQKVHWGEHLGFDPYTKTIGDANFVWDGNERFGTGFGISDWTAYRVSTDQPKFDHHPQGDKYYKEWWLNETPSESNPEADARHFEWSIDVYTVMTSFSSIGSRGLEPCNGLELYLRFQNNVESVFEVLGAEKAASYIIQAHVKSYTWAPADAGWHAISPDQGAFKLDYIGENTIPPSAPQQGSDLNFNQLEKYSDVAIKFEFAQFGTAVFGSDATVNIELELNVLTVGRFDYVLTYVEGGENQEGQVGSSGVLRSIGDALYAGYSALMDSALLDKLLIPLTIFVVIIGIGFVVMIAIRVIAFRRR